MRITLISLFILFSLSAFSQSNNTNSPYTRYGYGQLADQTFASQRAMGGIGYGLRNSQLINPLNPASFSAVDSMTFMLDFGIKGQLAWFNDPAFGKAQKYNGGLEYVAMQFPLAKGLGLGIGLAPVSYVGYQYGDTTHLGVLDGTSYNSYGGRGGLNKVYTTLSYKLWDRLSVGVNVGYLFGSIIHDKSASFSTANTYTTSWNDTLRTTGITYEAGIQYFHKLGKTEEIIFGAVYTPQIKTNSTVMTGANRYDSSGQLTGAPDHYSTKDSVFQLPETYGFGISYHKLDKLTVGADFQYQRWADAKFYDRTDSLSNRMKINLGMEYVHKLRYRVGAYYTDSYINVGGKGYKEYGATVGLGIPMVDKRSFINVAFEYAIIRPEVKTMIDEQYLKFTLSYTFNELWFFKRKLQ
jgi:hypothetical protein